MFTEDDLIELVLAVTAAKQSAIAGRESLSMQLTEIITEHGAQEAVEVLAMNPGAEWTDKAFRESLERFPSDPKIHEAIMPAKSW